MSGKDREQKEIEEKLQETEEKKKKSLHEMFEHQMSEKDIDSDESINDNDDNDESLKDSSKQDDYTKNSSTIVPETPECPQVVTTTTAKTKRMRKKEEMMNNFKKMYRQLDMMNIDSDEESGNKSEGDTEVESYSMDWEFLRKEPFFTAEMFETEEQKENRLMKQKIDLRKMALEMEAEREKLKELRQLRMLKKENEAREKRKQALKDAEKELKNRQVDPKRIEIIQKLLPVVDRDNIEKFKDAIKDVANTYDWPDYILNLKAYEWNVVMTESNHDLVRRKEAYTIIKNRIHKSIKDQIVEEEHRGDAQKLYRKLHEILVRNTSNYVIEIEAKIAAAYISGCSDKTVIEYGTSLKKLNDKLKTVGQPYDENKLISVYRKGLPQRLETVETKLQENEKIYNTLAKARAYAEEFVRDKHMQDIIFKKDRKYKVADTTEEKSHKKIRETNNNQTEKKEKVCYYFQKGTCKKAGKCPYKHVQKNNDNNKKDELEERKRQTRFVEKKKFPCKFFIAGNCKKGDKCDYLHENKERSNNQNEEKEEKELSMNVVEYMGTFEEYKILEVNTDDQ